MVLRLGVATGVSSGALATLAVLATAAADPPMGSRQVGEELARDLGCGVCHTGVPAPGQIREMAPEFGTVGAGVSAEFVFTYLEDPTRRRSDIGPARMPDFDLSEEERLALALFLGEGEPEVGSAVADARESWEEVSEEDGRFVFQALNCAGCHAHPEIQPAEGGALAPDLSAEGARVRPDWLRSFLEDPRPIRPSGTPPGSGSRMPDFRLSADEVESLAAYMEDQAPAATDEIEIPRLSPFQVSGAQRLVRDRLSCLGCHVMDGEGGRIGPSLDGVGERLRSSYLRAIIRTPQETVSGTVMPTPAYHPDGLDQVVGLLASSGDSWGGSDREELFDLFGERLEQTGPMPTAAGEGAVLYGTYCAHCHGSEGDADGWNAEHLRERPVMLSDSAGMSQRPDDTLYDGIAAGGWVLNQSNRMPGFGRTLDSDQIRALVAHIRELCDCTGPAWSRRREP